MKKDNKITGDLGEDMAKEYLLENNYVILEKNFRTRIGEIDLIVRDKDIIVFVEVKTRKSLHFGYPHEAVDRRKMHKIIRVSEQYIAYKGTENTQYRFDIIEVFLNQRDKINHIKDAFWL